MLTLWYHRIIGSLSAGACDALSLLEFLTVIAPLATASYYGADIVPFPPHRGGLFGTISYWIRRGRSRRS